MRLHEYYFDNMTRQPVDIGNGKLYNALGDVYGGFQEWKADFFAVSNIRGVGWAISYYDLASRQITNR